MRISFQSSTDLTNFLSQVDADAPYVGSAKARLFAATATRAGGRSGTLQYRSSRPAPLPGWADGGGLLSRQVALT